MEYVPVLPAFVEKGAVHEGWLQCHQTDFHQTCADFGSESCQNIFFCARAPSLTKNIEKVTTVLSVKLCKCLKTNLLHMYWDVTSAK